MVLIVEFYKLSAKNAHTFKTFIPPSFFISPNSTLFSDETGNGHKRETKVWIYRTDTTDWGRPPQTKEEFLLSAVVNLGVGWGERAYEDEQTLQF
jgi:hypothetical protein